MLRRLMVLIFLGMLPLIAADGNNGFPSYKNKVAVLIYHHVDDRDVSSVTITTDLLERQMRDLHRRGYRFITMEDFRRYMAGAPVPDNAVLVTFDDGYESFYSNAVPVLERYGVQAVNFVITSDVDQPVKGTLPSMSSQEMAQLTAKGLAELQCHSHNLHRLLNPKESYLSGLAETNGVRETDREYRQRVRKDTETSMRELSRFGQTVDSYAYPYGMYTTEVIGLLGDEGIRYAFTVKAGMTDRLTPKMEIPRINGGSPYMTPMRVHKAIMRAL